MAAFDTPWISHMAAPKSSQDDSHGDDGGTGPSSAPNPNPAPGGLPPTYASFSPVTLSASTPSRSSRRSTILVHQKSPLLLATPPQITRALAYSHPFLLPLNKAAGLLSWTTNDPWESFLLLCAFWAVVLYGDTVVRAAGPIVLVGSLIVAMYGRRYSPLSSSGWTEPPSKETAGNGNAHAANGAKGGAGGHHRSGSEVTSTRHQKTLDEIVDTLKEFTGRCNVLLGPALELTDFLSTQRTPTSATTRPALTALFVRILFCTPFWYALTLGPWRIITTRRVVLLLGTLVLTWHARIMRVARTILWRSATVRRTVTAITGLQFEKPVRANAASHEDDIVATTAAEGARHPARRTDSELTKALRKRSHKHGVNATGRDAGVKFTFIIYENQRRWVGLGWTQSLFAYERAAWTDEHNNQVPSKDEFELPEVEDGSRMRWRWVDSSKWRVDGVADDANKEVDYDGEAGKNGWIYYDNKWQSGRRGADGWGRWTRRRKWYRDAELVEEDENTVTEQQANVPQSDVTSKSYSTVGERMMSPTQQSGPGFPPDAAEQQQQQQQDTASQLSSSAGSRGFFRKPLIRRSTNQSTGTSASSATAVEGGQHGDAADKRHRRPSDGKSEADVDEVGLRVNLALQGQGQGSGGGWGIGDEARMSLE
ncbi:integral peroxisomal membrane peroxin [Plectosphaerella cucumerina]|uniref:Integral peroxisomal membrane peroxin n=1 Tax=Plectosphaerella cucumerina TaxID=40658 RepID=A0A8K0TSC2_9PEZI|nr:integral peroxisomal membrane peroxin [Plectosphaerella cucumerina]